jgi:hypothetical protein
MPQGTLPAGASGRRRHDVENGNDDQQSLGGEAVELAHFGLTSLLVLAPCPPLPTTVEEAAQKLLKSRSSHK